MQANISVSQPIVALNLNLAGLPSLLSETKTRLDAKRQPQFEKQAKILLNNCIEAIRRKARALEGGRRGKTGDKQGELNRVAETLRAELDRLSDLLMKSEWQIDSSEKHRLEFEVAKAVDKCIETLHETVEGLSPEGSKRLIQKWRKLHQEVETLSRRLELLQPSTKEALIATLWWMAERGTEAELDLLQNVSAAKLFDSEEVRALIAVAQQRISLRAFDQDDSLQRFFRVGPEGLTQLLGIVGLSTDISASHQACEVAAHLRAIRESVSDLFEQEEIDRWLHSPNDMFDGKTPLEAISGGQAHRVRQLLVRIEEGIPY